MKDFSWEILERYSIRGELGRDRSKLPEFAEDIYMEFSITNFGIYGALLKDVERMEKMINDIKKGVLKNINSSHADELPELIKSCEACCRDIRKEINSFDRETDPEKRYEINRKIIEKARELDEYHNQIGKIIYDTL